MVLCLALAMGACAAPSEAVEEESEAYVEVSPKTVVRPPSWVEGRVSATKERLSKSEAGELVWQAMEAHGGLEKWFTSGALTFRFRYMPIDGKTVRDSVQVIDPWDARAVHALPDDATKAFGWDGERAWATAPNEELGVNPRFWALTPFYFVGVPFVFGDDGVNLALEGQTEFEGRTYDLVRVTFDAGTGDAPDDFYVLYVDAETKRVGGVRYVVSYPGFFPQGGNSPEKFMAYDGAQTAGDIVFPRSFRTFKWVDGAPGEHVTNSTMTEVGFDPTARIDGFAMPEGARVIEGY